jgi:hypothetical protein
MFTTDDRKFRPIEGGDEFTDAGYETLNLVTPCSSKVPSPETA